MKDNTIIIIAVLAAAGYYLYKSGFFTQPYSDKYTAYAQQLQGLANNATDNFLSVHNGISSGINNQVNSSVNTALSSINNFAQMAAQNRDNKDRREYEQFMSILSTI